MRRLFVAALVVGMSVVGAAYLGSLRLGHKPIFCNIDTGFAQPAHPALCVRPGADWQVPASILIGVLGVAVGALVVGTLAKRPLRGPAQSA